MPTDLLDRSSKLLEHVPEGAEPLAALVRELLDENRRLVAMLDALPDHLILQDRDARVQFLNRSAVDMASQLLGRPRDQLIGVPVLEQLSAGPFRDYIANLSKRVVGGETVREEFLMPGVSGTEWREHFLAPVLRADGEVEGIAIASRNIHARKQAEGRLQLLAKIAALTIDNSCVTRVAELAVPELADVAILEVLEDGVVRDHEVVPPQALTVEVRRLEVADLAPRIVRAGDDDPRARLLRELGAATAIVVPFVVLGVPICVATFAFTAASQRRHGPDDLAIAEEVARRIAQVVENARLHEHRERVMGILGHDLRNPLAAVLSLSTMLTRRSDVSERTKEGLDHIRRSGERMDQMIRTILDFTQLRFRGSLPLAIEAFDLEHLARTVVDELRCTHPNRDITLDARGNVHGRWDFTRLGQVLSNLVGNALTHGERTSPVHVRITAEDRAVLVDVSNRGPTIAAEALDKLFEPFWQGSSESRGLGLGLFIAQQIVHSHGGRIDVRSRDEQTTFTVRLPRGV